MSHWERSANGGKAGQMTEPHSPLPGQRGEHGPSAQRSTGSGPGGLPGSLAWAYDLSRPSWAISPIT